MTLSEALGPCIGVFVVGCGAFAWAIVTKETPGLFDVFTFDFEADRKRVIFGTMGAGMAFAALVIGLCLSLRSLVPKVSK